MSESDAIVRLDALRAKRLGQMLVGDQTDAQYEADPHEVLVDLEKLDGKELLERYVAEHAKYGTAPFDPEGDMLRFFPGGVTIWSGFPGAGKTTLLRQFVCHCLARGSSVFLASLEESPRRLIVELASVAAGRPLANAHQVQWFIDAYAQRFKLYNVIGIAEHRRILAVVRKLAQGGVKHAVIDSLMKLDISNDDYEAQRRFANLLAATAQAENIHLHLVAHPRKAVSADQEPDLNDVAGAREIGGIADNVIFVRRAEKNEFPKSEQTAMQIVIRKQRHGTGALGQIAGWFHRPLRQYHSAQFPQGPTRYLPEDAYT